MGASSRTRIGALGASLAAALMFLPVEARSQAPETEVERPAFEFLSSLVGHRCAIRESWPNGQPFRLDKEFAWGLDGRIVTVNSFVVDADGERQPRNHGIRAYPNERDGARFWEFDRSGNVTEGPVWVEGDTLFYQYPYGDEVLRDSWTALGGGDYRFMVRAWVDGAWGPTYMDGTYRCREIGAER